MFIFQWHIGDSCQAIFSEDEQIYDAVIINIDSSSNTCTVKFCGYGNTEEQSLNDLLPPTTKKNGKSLNNTESYSDWPQSSEHLVIDISSHHRQYLCLEAGLTTDRPNFAEC